MVFIFWKGRDTCHLGKAGAGVEGALARVVYRSTEVLVHIFFNNWFAAVSNGSHTGPKGGA